MTSPTTPTKTDPRPATGTECRVCGWTISTTAHRTPDGRIERTEICGCGPSTIVEDVRN